MRCSVWGRLCKPDSF